MAKLNPGKFMDCLVKYKRDCESTVWTKREISKFYFANLLARRIQIEFQTSEMIFEICKRIEEKDFYFHNSETNICGIQYLKSSGKSDFTEPISITDVELLKYLSKYENLLETDFEKRNISYQTLSGWAGTLIAHKFIPVTSGEFRHTIAYLFDIEPLEFEETDYDFFTHTQEHFELTKEKLKQFELESLYLRDIAEYIKFSFPKAAPKRNYSEYDWNWLTQDFHLYIYREILCLDKVDRISVLQKENEFDTPGENFKKPEVLNIYIP